MQLSYRVRLGGRSLRGKRGRVPGLSVRQRRNVRRHSGRIRLLMPVRYIRQHNLKVNDFKYEFHSKVLRATSVISSWSGATRTRARTTRCASSSTSRTSATVCRTSTGSDASSNTTTANCPHGQSNSFTIAKKDYDIFTLQIIFRCFNGGKCLDGVDDFSCSCPPDHSGSQCHCPLGEEENSEQVSRKIYFSYIFPLLNFAYFLLFKCLNLNESISWTLPPTAATTPSSILPTTTFKDQAIEGEEEEELTTRGTLKKHVVNSFTFFNQKMCTTSCY